MIMMMMQGSLARGPRSCALGARCLQRGDRQLTAELGAGSISLSGLAPIQALARQSHSPARGVACGGGADGSSGIEVTDV
jgi:hypothetical protein